jgi:hypothetical protein
MNSLSALSLIPDLNQTFIEKSIFWVLFLCLSWFLTYTPVNTVDIRKTIPVNAVSNMVTKYREKS